MIAPRRMLSSSNGAFNVLHCVLVELIRMVNNAFLIASSAPNLGCLTFDKHFYKGWATKVGPALKKIYLNIHTNFETQKVVSFKIVLALKIHHIFSYCLL